MQHAFSSEIEMPVEKSIASVARPRIMLVDDDPAVRRSLQLLLQSRGFDVRAHASGVTLLADPAARDASCLIADYRLHDGDGVGTLLILRQRGWVGPALLITAFNSPRLTALALTAGFDSVIDKPLREGFLLATLARLIEPVQPASA